MYLYSSDMSNEPEIGTVGEINKSERVLTVKDPPHDVRFKSDRPQLRRARLLRLE